MRVSSIASIPMGKASCFTMRLKRMFMLCCSMIGDVSTRGPARRNGRLFRQELGENGFDSPSSYCFP